MHVTLKGSSPGATTAGIMLLTRARQLGYPLSVAVAGDPDDIVPIRGPAICYAPVLASCGVGREMGSGATVVVPGPPGEPLLVTVHPHGVSGWFEVDRSGEGAHPASQAFVRLSRDPRPRARALGLKLRRSMEALGLSRDPAVLDVLFSAQVPPLTRLAVGLRTGRAMSGDRGQPITRFLSGFASNDPLPPDYDESFTRSADLGWIADGLSTSVQDAVTKVVRDFRSLANEDGGADLVLLYHLAELASQLVQLPSRSILPPLGAAEDSVATGLRSALSAFGDGDASRQLIQVFQFLGGTFTQDETHAIAVCNAQAPPDKVGRWTWFCAQVRQGRKDADRLWPDLFDPPS
jgi:hypothetical protein